MSLIPEMIGVAVGAIATASTSAIAYVGYKHSKKRESKSDIDNDKREAVTDAVALSTVINDIGWIKEQLGKNPNGGGAMEQLLTHAKQQGEMITSISSTLREHLNWHVARDK